MEQGPNADKIVAMARKQKMPVPDKIKNAPNLSVGLVLYWRAFQDLSSDRDIGMGVGPIPWTSMDAWAARNRIRGDSFERFVMILRGMDGAFMEKQGKKTKGKMNKGKGGFKKPTAMRSK